MSRLDCASVPHHLEQTSANLLPPLWLLKTFFPLFALSCAQIAIMNELIQAYLAAEDTLIQDRAAYAIQESIKFMKLGAKSPGFSADAQEVG